MARVLINPQSFRTQPSPLLRTDLRDAKQNADRDKGKVMDTADYQYYNIRIYHDINATGLMPAIYKETRTEPILDNPSEYELAVVRFSIPASIPIFLWPQTVDPITGDKTGLPNDTIYQISLKYVPTNTLISKPVVYVDNCVNCAYPLGVYNYQDLIDAINTAYEQAFTDLKALEPLMPPTEPPFLYLNTATGLISLYCEETYTDPNETQIAMSALLYDTYFPSFYTFADFINTTFSSRLRFIVKDLKLNKEIVGGKQYLVMTQAFTTLPLWSDFVALVLESDTIPVEPEYEPAQTNIVRRIITDFEPSTAGNNDRQSFQFFPQGAIRYYDLKSNYPMRTIDVRVYLQAKDGDTYLLQITRGQYMNIKLQFRKKGLKDRDKDDLNL